MLQAEGQSLKMRDIIFLNETAQPWTRGLIMTVHEVKGWGVICWTTEATSSDSHVAAAQAFYRAPWDQIAGRASVQAELPGAARQFQYPD